MNLLCAVALLMPLLHPGHPHSTGDNVLFYGVIGGVLILGLLAVWRGRRKKP